MTESGADNQPGVANAVADRSAYDRILLFIGSMAFIGFVPFASGTVTVAVWGVPLALLLLVVLQLSVPMFVGFIVVFTLASIWIAGEADRVLNEKDSKRKRDRRIARVLDCAGRAADDVAGSCGRVFH